MNSKNKVKRMTAVVVVESPSKAKTINKYLGKDYSVIASFGHIRDLPSKDGSVEPDNNFTMHYQVPKDSEKHIKDIVRLMKNADTLYLATDPDREGEAISWHVLEELKQRVKHDFKVHRIEFHEITKKAVTEAVKKPREIAMPMVNAQQARRALDYLVGFNLSPVLWRKVRGGLSAGRVQSVALRLICEREIEIKNFVKQEYWSVQASLTNDGSKPFVAKLTHFNGEKLDKFSLNSETSTMAVVNAIQGNDFIVKDIERKESKRNPSAPFTTSTLQQEASRKLRFGARKTMQVAQQLYEGVSLGGETVGLITYMRTDSFTLSSEAIQGCREQIETMYGADYVPKSPRVFKTKSKNAQEAHEAIRPTSLSRTPESMRSYLDDDQYKLYDLIWKRTIASQMEQARLDQTGINIVAGDAIFRATGSIVTFAGFLKVYREGMDDNQDDGMDDKLLPSMNTEDVLDCKELKPEQHFTEPPPRYSEATLVKSLEEKGIGRPSTFAAIVSTIRDRGYVKLEQRRFKPEDIGMVVNKFLTEHFSTYVDYDFTANMEDDLDAISRGEQEWIPMMEAFWSPFKALVDDKMQSVRKSDVTSEKTGEACPSCGKGELLIRLGKYGKFKGCSNYPECRHIENLEGNTAAENMEKQEQKSTGIQCPKCKENDIVEKKSRRGKIFYGCAGYPKCDYALWDKPIEEACPSCKNAFITVKETKRYGEVKKCPNCDWQDPPAPAKKEPAKKAEKKDA